MDALTLNKATARLLGIKVTRKSTSAGLERQIAEHKTKLMNDFLGNLAAEYRISQIPRAPTPQAITKVYKQMMIKFNKSIRKSAAKFEVKTWYVTWSFNTYYQYESGRMRHNKPEQGVVTLIQARKPTAEAIQAIVDDQIELYQAKNIHTSYKAMVKDAQVSVAAKPAPSLVAFGDLLNADENNLMYDFSIDYSKARAECEDTPLTTTFTGEFQTKNACMFDYTLQMWSNNKLTPVGWKCPRLNLTLESLSTLLGIPVGPCSLNLWYEKFAKPNKISTYVVNIHNICCFKRVNEDRLPAAVFRLVGQHVYPIMNKKKRASIINSTKDRTIVDTNAVAKTPIFSALGVITVCKGKAGRAYDKLKACRNDYGRNQEKIRAIRAQLVVEKDELAIKKLTDEKIALIADNLSDRAGLKSSQTLIVTEPDLSFLFREVLIAENRVCGFESQHFPKFSGANMVAFSYPNQDGDLVSVYANSDFDLFGKLDNIGNQPRIEHKPTDTLRKYAGLRLADFRKAKYEFCPIREKKIETKPAILDQSRYNDFTAFLREPLKAKMWSEEITEDTLKNYTSVDIKACYPSALINNTDDYCVFTEGDEPKAVNHADIAVLSAKNKLPLAFYWVETEDKSLFNGSNKYTRSLVARAFKFNIAFKVTHLCESTYSLKHDTYKDLFTSIYAQSTYDNAKLIAVTITGLLGKRYSNKQETKYLKYGPELALRFQESGSYAFSSCFATTSSGIQVGSITYKRKVLRTSDSMPIYNQMMCNYYIALHELTTAVPFTAIRFKTDAIYFEATEGQVNAIIANQICPCANYCQLGHKYRYEKKLSACKKSMYELVGGPPPTVAANVYVDFEGRVKADDDRLAYVQKVADHLQSGKSLQIRGRGGTGKTWKALMPIYEELIKRGLKCEKLAFTNVAAKMIGGQTFHKGLGIDLEDSITKVKHLQNLDIVICDEISMISDSIFSKMLSLRRMGIPLLLVGDFRQLPPIFGRKTNRKMDYQDSHLLHFLSDGNLTTLKECVRADEETFNLMENVRNIKWRQMAGLAVETDFNICHTNQTRKEVNESVNNRIAAATQLKVTVSMGKDNLCQEMQIYASVPVMAIRTIRSKGEIRYANGERFKVLRWTPKSFELESEDGPITVSDVEFGQNFVLAYCITVHKSQGKTVDEAYTIHEFEMMGDKLAYTALSRTTDFNKVTVIRWGKRYMAADLRPRV
jgi:hypothetical protein